jgi:ABC-type dipeptide/oligopeptide/nickel transport system permease subunit
MIEEAELGGKENLETATARRRLHQTKGFFAASFGRFLSSRLNVAALLVLVLIILISLFAPLITANILNIKPERTNVLDAFRAPGFTEKTREGLIVHWLGTDEVGRDTLARLLHAGGASLTVGFLVMVIITLVGMPLGLAAGYFGGWVDDLVNVLIQFIFNVPSLYIFIILGNIFRPDIIFLAFLFGLLGWGTTARQVRGLTLSLKNRDYVAASLVSGASPARVLFQHILPNVTSILLVLAGTDVASAMLGEASLSFLGFGIRDPDVSWGKLLSKSSDYLTFKGNQNPFLILGPGIVIFITVLVIYLIADGLRDAFDPSLKR